MLRNQVGLPEDKFVFACFVQTLRIDLSDLKTWAKILTRVPQSVLWLKDNPEAKKNILQILSKWDIDPKRIIWAENMPDKQSHLERLVLADLVLDTSIYGGHTTTVDALWAGVPVITRYGRHFASRVTSSILKALDMDMLVAGSREEYIKIASKLATNTSWYLSVRDQITQKKYVTNLFNTKKYTRELEKLYREMYDNRNR
jgi:predicted O-linked N-acetylglucosamine transferase (SPINDLY family)